MRPHGKWGDLLACLIPISWCINILINSNFLLKLIEWQNESSLFTLRIRGKQWYWVYKLDFKNFTNIITAPKNVGHNKWVLFSHNSIKQSDDYMSAIQLRKQTKLVKEYWSEVCGKEELAKSPMNSSFYESVTRSTKKIFYNEQFKQAASPFLLSNSVTYPRTFVKTILQPLSFDYNINVLVRLAKSSNIKDNKLSGVVNSNFLEADQYNSRSTFSRAGYLSTNAPKLAKSRVSVGGSLFEYDSRFYKRKEGANNAITIRPTFLCDSTISSMKAKKTKLIVVRYDTGHNEIVSKPKPHNNFMVMKQKRYKRRKDIKVTEYSLGSKAMEYYNTKVGVDQKTTNKFKGQILLNRDSSLDYIHNNQGNLSNKYKFFMKNKIRGEEASIVTNRRMIRTKRTLVLPAHVNLTAITNSYDVIHSWFIPGLGLKMDCIPGRSTHHTFYIDNVGFYYGQCAEVCGRYHHHMPIRICALPFNHFLLWWHHFGVPKLLPNNTSKKIDITSGLRKYVW